jgi:hypothetical protein
MNHPQTPLSLSLSLSLSLLPICIHHKDTTFSKPLPQNVAQNFFNLSTSFSSSLSLSLSEPTTKCEIRSRSPPTQTLLHTQIIKTQNPKPAQHTHTHKHTEISTGIDDEVRPDFQELFVCLFVAAAFVVRNQSAGLWWGAHGKTKLQPPPPPPQEVRRKEERS